MSDTHSSCEFDELLSSSFENLNDWVFEYPVSFLSSKELELKIESYFKELMIKELCGNSNTV